MKRRDLLDHKNRPSRLPAMEQLVQESRKSLPKAYLRIKAHLTLLSLKRNE